MGAGHLAHVDERHKFGKQLPGPGSAGDHNMIITLLCLDLAWSLNRVIGPLTPSGLPARVRRELPWGCGAPA